MVIYIMYSKDLLITKHRFGVTLDKRTDSSNTKDCPYRGKVVLIKARHCIKISQNGHNFQKFCLRRAI